MTAIPRFVFPWALVLLSVIPWSIWTGARIRSLSGSRKWAAITMRSVMLFCLACALAGAELVRVNDKLAVFFLLDQSESIPPDLRSAQTEAVRGVCQESMTGKDEAGVIVFAEEASIELSTQPKPEVGEVRSYVGGQQTDLAAAIRLAMAAFPQGHMKRLVIYTDGNETRGNALEEIKLASAAGAEVNIVPLDIGGRSEVKIREVLTPGRVNAEEPFKIQVVAQADQDCEGTLRVYQRTQEGKRLLQSAGVTLQEGDNAFLLSQELGTPGFYEYEATIESAADTIVSNNRGRAFTVIQGEPRVLYLDANAGQNPRLGTALVDEGLNVVQVDIAGFPSNLTDFQNYDSVVLSNVSSTDLTSEQIRSLEAMVRDLGIGLVMVGGPDSFGAGGYFDTAVEKALPVSMDIKERKIMPRGALALIMHTCEFDQGNAWAREIALAALNVLGPQDIMGALAYHWERGDDWLYNLQPVGDKHLMRMALNTTEIGDMPSIQPTLEMACSALKEADAAVKRVILISDGDPAAPTRKLLDDLAEAKISVSTICISPHGPSDESRLSDIAKRTGGEYYFVTDPANLPQIFTKEASVVKRGILFEKPFIPQFHHDSEILRGLTSAEPPMLRGYVVTTLKENSSAPLLSSEGDPVLAHWRYGLGKSVAFTSDVTTLWAPDWLNWDGFGRFWAQTVRWSMRDAAPSTFRVSVNARDGMGHVRIDAVDDNGKFVNFLRPRGVVTGPAPGFARAELPLAQTAPGIYEGSFPVDQDGVYMANLTYSRQDGSTGMIPAGLAMGYSREYERNQTNLPRLEELAMAGGGNLLKADYNPFEHNLKAAAVATPVWPQLIVAALCIFPVEVFVRRVMVDFAAPFVWLMGLLGRLPGLRGFIREPALKPGRLTGSYGTMSRASQGRVYTSSSEAGFVMPRVDEPPAPISVAVPLDQPQADPNASGKTDYTSQLLAAKGRALDRRSRRTRKTGNEENPK